VHIMLPGGGGKPMRAGPGRVRVAPVALGRTPDGA
jgi:hypothetical protein